jgi:hypothetical protein
LVSEAKGAKKAFIILRFCSPKRYIVGELITASGVRVAEKGLKVICGGNTGYLENEAWITEKIRYELPCQIRVSPKNGVKPNLGGIELAEALSRVIPFTATGDDRPVLACVRFAQKGGKLTLTSSGGFRLAEVSLDFRDGEGEALIPAEKIGDLITALDKETPIIISIKNGMMRLSVEDDRGEAQIQAQAEDKPMRKRKAKEPVAVA